MRPAQVACVAMTVLSLAASGCIGTSESPDPGTRGTILDGTLHLDACSGLVASTLLPSQLWAGELPPGWSDDGPVHVSFLVLECERVYVGPFERGPIRLMRQEHRNPDGGGRCTEGGFDDVTFLQALWVSDPEVAAYLRQAYGMPAAYAQIMLERSSDPGDGTWWFGLPGQAQSRLDFANATYLGTAVTVPVERMAWVNQEGGVTYLDGVRGYSYASLPLVTGKVRPPLAYTTTSVEDFVAAGDSVWHLSAAGAFHQFRDPLCTESF